MRTVITMAAALPAVSSLHAQDLRDVTCAGSYRHHLQGICVDDEALDWSFTTTLAKTEVEGKVLLSVPVANHHGDLCHVDGRIYGAVNLGRFNDPAGKADSWVYVHDAAFRILGRHAFDCALGIEGLPEGRLLAAGGRCDKNNTSNGCTGSVRVAVPDEKPGLTHPGHGNPH